MTEIAIIEEDNNRRDWVAPFRATAGFLKKIELPERTKRKGKDGFYKLDNGCQIRIEKARDKMGKLKTDSWNLEIIYPKVVADLKYWDEKKYSGIPEQRMQSIVRAVAARAEIK